MGDLGDISLANISRKIQMLDINAGLVPPDNMKDGRLKVTCFLFKMVQIGPKDKQINQYF